jgi:hypothetical protein
VFGVTLAELLFLASLGTGGILMFALVFTLAGSVIWGRSA